MAAQKQVDAAAVPVRPPVRPPARPVRPPAAIAADPAGGDIYVPRVLRTSAALGWRLLVVVAALYVIGTVTGYLAALVVPVRLL